MTVNSMYMKMKAAASYCGYSLSTFKRHIRKYPLPKYGPKHNRFKCTDLDGWMEDPTKYIDAGKGTSSTAKTRSREQFRQELFGMA